MELYDIKRGDRLESVKVKQFKYEKDIQDIVEKNLNQLFQLQFISSEFTIKNFRIDTLSFDKSKPEI